MKTVFMGTPDFSVPALKKLIESGNEVGYVVTQPDRARNRGKKILMSPVKETAVEAGIEVLQPEKVKKDEDFVEILKAYEPDIMIVAAYGQILTKEILDIPKYGCINIHASLLPRFRGASPIQHAILEGDKVTGVTIMQMAEGLDTGDMLSKTEVEIGRMNAEELHDALSEKGGELLIKTLKDIEDGKICPEKQDDTLSTYAGMIDKKDGKIDFENETACEIERKVRAFTPWPGAYAIYDEKNMKIKEAEVIEGSTAKEPGTVLVASDEGIDVATKEGIFRIKVLQMPGKRAMDTADFLRGNEMKEGTLLK